MVYRSSIDGGYGSDASVFHVDASQADRVDIPDAALLFRGHFARSGPDLVLTGQDGHRHIVPGYFATEKHPDLVAPNGAHLSGDTVSLLAGSPTPGHYAQAGTTLPPEAIGKVEKIVGTVTLIHNGVSGPLHVGDAVFKTDVIETGPNSSCGIGFPDGTALDLVAGTRMALNDFSFDANNGGSNNALFTLVEGTFAFVAGKVAHTGNGMQIATPVATMGIRGTVGLFRSEPTVINANLGHVWSVFLHEDLDGSHHLGRIALIDEDPTSPTYGQVFYLLDSSEYIAYLEPRGPGLSPLVRLEPITNSKIFDDRHFYDDLGQIINSYLNGNVNPQSTPGTPGSSTPPDLLKIEFQPFQGNSNQPIFNYFPFYGGQNPGGGPPQPPGNLGIPVQPGQIPNTPGSSTPPSIIFIWNGNGPWPTTSPWNQGAAPNSPIDQVIVQSGTLNYDLPNTFVSFLTVDPGATLDVTGGQLTAGGLIDNGTIIVDGDPPALVISGPATIGSTGSLDAQDGTVTLVNGSFLNQGKMTADHGGMLLIEENGTNVGTIAATDGGIVTIENATIVNSSTDAHGNITDGNIQAFAGSHVELDNATILQGFVGIEPGGFLDTVAGTHNFINTANGPTHNTTVPSISNAGIINIADNSTLALASPYDIENFGSIDLNSTGHQTILYFNQPFPILAGGGNIVLEGGAGSQDIIAGLTGQGFTTVNLDNQGDTISGAGAIGQNDGALTFTNDDGTNHTVGTINADLNGQTLFIETGSLFTNNALMEATNGGILDVLDNVAGTGSVAISSDGLAKFAGIFNENAAFLGPGALELAHSRDGAYGGTITGFAGGDALVLDDIAFDTSGGESAVWCNGVLSIFDDGTLETTINVSGSYSSNSFAVVDDNGVTEVVLVGDEWIGPSPQDRTGKWIIGSNWTLGVPTPELNAIVDLPGKYSITTSGDQAANSLTITDTEATLKGSGTLTFVTFENDGKIKAVDDHHLVLEFQTGTNFGTIAAVGGTLGLKSSEGASAQLTNYGRLIAKDHGRISVDGITVFNQLSNNDGSYTPALIKAAGCGSEITFSGGSALFNYGHAVAADGGKISFDGVAVFNETTPVATDGESQKFIPGMIEAIDCGSTITFSHGAELFNLGAALARDGGQIDFRHARVDNETGGTIEAGRSGTVSIFKTAVDNETDATIAAVGHDARVIIADSSVTNTGFLLAANCGSVCVDDSTVHNQSGGQIEAKDGGIITFGAAFLTNSAASPPSQNNPLGRPAGEILARDGGAIKIDHSRVVNGGTIEAVGLCSVVILSCDLIGNTGLALAKDAGLVEVHDSKFLNDGGGDVQAEGCDSVVAFCHDCVVNTHGAEIAATDFGSVVFDDDRIANKHGSAILASDGGAVEIDHSDVANKGGSAIEAFDRGRIFIDSSHVDNGRGSDIQADGCGSEIKLDCDRIDNSGSIDAAWGGIVLFDRSSVDNSRSGSITADGRGSEIKFVHDRLENSGLIKVERGAAALFDRSQIDNARGGSIEAVGLCSAIIFSCDLIGNTGLVLAKDGGLVEVTDSKLLNYGTGEIASKDCASIVAFCHDSIANKHGADITATDFGSIVFEDDKIANKHDSTIDATNGGIINIDYSEVINKHDSVIKAGDGGTVTLADDCITNAGVSTIEAKGHHSTVNLEDTFVLNDCGTIAAIGRDATVNLFDTTIVGGTLETRDGGIIENPSGTSTLVGVTLAGGTFETSAGAFIDLKGTTTINGTVTFEGGGTFKLVGPDARIAGDAGTLDNYSTIVGAGRIGNDDLTLVNEPGSSHPDHSAGVIDADVAHQKLIIDTGCNTVTNGGLLEATKGGMLVLDSAVDNGGTIKAHDGTIIIKSGGSDDIISARNGGTVAITDDSVGHIDGSAFGAGDRINADGRGSSVTIEDGSNFADCNTVSATCGATVTITDGASFGSDNDIDAAGRGSTLTVEGPFTRFGDGNGVYAAGDGVLTVDGSSFGNYDSVFATDAGTLTVKNGSSFGDCDTVDATCGAIVKITGGAAFGSHDQVYATGNGSTLTVKGTAPVVGNWDCIYATGDSALTVDGSSFGDHDSAYAAGESTLIIKDGDTFVNGDTVDATCGSAVTITGGAEFGSNDQVYADGGSTLLIKGLGSVFGDHDNIYTTGDSTLTVDGSSFGSHNDIFATGASTLSVEHGSTFADGDTVDATGGATLTITGGASFGSHDDIYAADAAMNGNNSTVTVEGSSPVFGDNDTVYATGGSDLTIDSSSFGNHDTVAATGGSELLVKDSSFGNDVSISATDGGNLTIKNGSFGDGESFGLSGGAVTIDGTTASGYGTLSGSISSLGTIDADENGKTLTIDSGHAITGANTFEASDHGALLVDDAVTGGGTALVKGGTIDFAAAADISQIVFNNGGGTDYGEAIFNDAKGLDATVSGFTGTQPNLADSDGIELTGSWTVKSETDSDGILTLELKDGSKTATFNFDEFSGTLNIAHLSDGDTLITDPAPATNTSTPSVSVGGAGDDTFVFHPGEGAETASNFNAQNDTIELDHFANIQNAQELAAAITSNAHGDAVIELGHNDSVAIPGMTASYLQAHLQNLAHLH